MKYSAHDRVMRGETVLLELARNGGNITQAAKDLGMSRHTLVALRNEAAARYGAGKWPEFRDGQLADLEIARRALMQRITDTGTPSRDLPSSVVALTRLQERQQALVGGENPRPAAKEVESMSDAQLLELAAPLLTVVPDTRRSDTEAA